MGKFQKTLGENGIGTGDVLYVASDIAGVLVDARKELEITTGEDRSLFCDGIVNVLQELVGRKGLVLFPGQRKTRQ